MKYSTTAPQNQNPQGFLLTTPQDELARDAFRDLLAGKSPGGIAPGEVGPWGETLERLYAGYDEGGSERVIGVFATLAEFCTDLAQLILEDQNANLFLTESADDEGNAQCVLRLHPARFVYCPEQDWLYRQSSLGQMLCSPLTGTAAPLGQGEREAKVCCPEAVTQKVSYAHQRHP